MDRNARERFLLFAVVALVALAMIFGTGCSAHRDIKPVVQAKRYRPPPWVRARNGGGR